MLRNYLTIFFLFFSTNIFSKNIEIIGLDKLSIEDLKAISSIDIFQKIFLMTI